MNFFRKVFTVGSIGRSEEGQTNVDDIIQFKTVRYVHIRKRKTYNRQSHNTEKTWRNA